MNFTREDVGPLALVTLVTKRGIKVTGAYVKAYQPEMQAATGATLSRDPGSIESRLKKVFGSETMSQRILDIYFKKYGHNSIGDMGNFIFSVEGLSMVGAFHLLEDRLFNGQEASTRYLDFTSTGYLPVDKHIDIHSDACMNMYKSVLNSEMKKNIEELGMSEKDAEPKAFDVAGAFLPISARTNVSWFGSIRTLIRKIRELRSMGDEEKEIGEVMSLVFDEICPNSQRDVGEDYLKDELTFKKKLNKAQARTYEVPVEFNNFNLKWFNSFMKDEEELSWVPNLGIFGSITASFPFDFRSARDIHRHRAFMVNTVLDWRPKGFEDFYLKQVSDPVLREEINMLSTQSKALFDKVGEKAIYGVPMAMKFDYIMSGALDAWLYFCNLRSGPKVHPTVIGLVQNIIGPRIERELNLKDIYQRGEVDYGKRSGDKNKV